MTHMVRRQTHFVAQLGTAAASVPRSFNSRPLSCPLPHCVSSVKLSRISTSANMGVKTDKTLNRGDEHNAWVGAKGPSSLDLRSELVMAALSIAFL